MRKQTSTRRSIIDYADKPTRDVRISQQPMEPTVSIRSTLRQVFSLRPVSSVPADRVIRQQFHDLFNEPISEQHQRHFKQYFRSDISAKTFTGKEFGQMFQMKSTLSERLLAVFNLQKAFADNSILGSDIIRIARVLWSSPTSVKAFILFKLFDRNDDNTITIEEIRTFYENYTSGFKFFRDEEHHKEVFDIFLRGLFPVNQDQSQSTELTFDQFYRTLQDNPDVFKSLYLISIPDQDKEEEKERSRLERSWMYIKNNLNRLAFLFLYILIQAALIAYVCVYRTTVEKSASAWQVIARVGGMLINFNYAVAVSLMIKQLMTIIRKIRYLRLIIPVDDHIDAHRLVGTMLFVSAMVHSLGHTIHFATHTDQISWPRAMFTTAAQIGWVANSAPITGDILFVVLMVMFICSLQCIRQRIGFYQVFRYTHYLFWPLFILLVIHSRDFWKWAIGPMILFGLEKLYLFKRYLPTHGRTRLRQVRMEDDNVLTLVMERPTSFTFETGSYINICLPKIAKMEWHPFTISSAPERTDIIRVNIMKQKNWTKKVYDYFNTRATAVDLTAVVTETDSDACHSNVKEIIFTADDEDAIVLVEGPFSTCTSYVFDCEHVVLIGAGIGVTPSIGALESLLQRFHKERCVCPKCNEVSYNHERLNGQKLKKVDFIWVNREPSSFSWFHNILVEFESEQDTYLKSRSASTNPPQRPPSRYLDIHLYCTSLRRNEAAMLEHLPYDLVANMYAAMQQHDMHTKLKAPTHVGRPPWKLLFAKFKAEKRSTSVFFTGNAVMAAEIKRHCEELGFAFRHEPSF